MELESLRDLFVVAQRAKRYDTAGFGGVRTPAHVRRFEETAGLLDETREIPLLTTSERSDPLPGPSEV